MRIEFRPHDVVLEPFVVPSQWIQHEAVGLNDQTMRCIEPLVKFLGQKLAVAIVIHGWNLRVLWSFTVEGLTNCS